MIKFLIGASVCFVVASALTCDQSLGVCREGCNPTLGAYLNATGCGVWEFCCVVDRNTTTGSEVVKKTCDQWGGTCSDRGNCKSHYQPSSVTDCAPGDYCCETFKPGKDPRNKCSDLNGTCTARDSCAQWYPSSTIRDCTDDEVCCTVPKKTCGRAGNIGNMRVVGGEDANVDAWPWQISLQFSGRHICGGSIIAKQWIVSAAHCFQYPQYPQFYKIKVGANTFGLTNGRDVSVSKIIIHESWRGQVGALEGDVALLKLTSPLTYSNSVNEVCRADSSDLGDMNVDKDCYTTGWGMTNGATQAMPKTLQQAKGPVISLNQCNSGPNGWGGRIQSTQLCFGNGVDPQTACRGDSGGPLVCRKPGGHFNLIGIVSWGLTSCKGRPGIFTRVTHYNEWIDRKIATN